MSEDIISEAKNFILKDQNTKNLEKPRKSELKENTKIKDKVKPKIKEEENKKVSPPLPNLEKGIIRNSYEKKDKNNEKLDKKVEPEVEKNKTVIKNYQSSDPDSMIGYGEVGHHKAIVFGSPSLETGTEFGVIACLANNDKSALVNLPGYRYGMSQIIRVPAEGREVDLYHEKEGKSYSCTILQKPEHDLELLRNRWVVAKLQRHRKYKRAFEIMGLPDEFC